MDAFILDEIRVQLELKIKDAVREHDENRAHGLCEASELIKEVARYNKIKLNFESEFVDEF